MREISFNGLGKPLQDNVESGDILIWINQGAPNVVKLEIVPEDQYGPFFHAAKNNSELLEEAKRLLTLDLPESLSDKSKQWVIECPSSLAERAKF